MDTLQIFGYLCSSAVIPNDCTPTTLYFRILCKESLTFEFVLWNENLHKTTRVFGNNLLLASSYGPFLLTPFMKIHCLTQILKNKTKFPTLRTAKHSKQTGKYINLHTVILDIHHKVISTNQLIQKISVHWYAIL